MNDKHLIELKQIKLQSLLNLLDIKRKRLNQLTSFIYLSPILYLLITGDLLKTFEFGGTIVNSNDVILGLFPIFYSVTLLMILFYGKKFYKIRQSIKTEFGSTAANTNWFRFLNISNFLDDLLVSFQKSKFMSYIFLVPLGVFFLIIPFVFLSLIIFHQFYKSYDSSNLWYLVSPIISLYLLVGIIYHFKNLVSKEQRNKILRLLKK